MIKVEIFDSVHSFVDTISSRPMNGAFKKAGVKSSVRKSPDHAEWSGTWSMEEADDLMRNGYPDGLKSLLEAGRQMALHTTQRVRKERRVNVVGCAPHIGNAIIGLPKSMIEIKKLPNKQRALSIIYDCGASCGVGANELGKGGANAMALLKYIESRGISVNFYVMVSASTGGHHAAAVVKVKDAKQRLNPLLCSYPITHPSFMRRHCFAWIETSAYTDRADYVSGYGCATRYVVSRDELVKDLRSSHRQFENAIYIDCEQAAMANSLYEMIEQTNLEIK